MQSNYRRLSDVLQMAYNQAAVGKGAERHANALPFEQQPMQQIAKRRGIGFLLGQADKKTEEAQGMLERGEVDAAVREILGAINYLAGAVIFVEGSRTPVAANDNGAILEAEQRECAHLFVENHRCLNCGAER